MTEITQYARLGLVTKTDTLKGYRLMLNLTVKAMAGEMGMLPYHYEMFESGQWKVKTNHLKAAANIVRWYSKMMDGE